MMSSGGAAGTRRGGTHSSGAPATPVLACTDACVHSCTGALHLQRSSGGCTVRWRGAGSKGVP